MFNLILCKYINICTYIGNLVLFRVRLCIYTCISTYVCWLIEILKNDNGYEVTNSASRQIKCDFTRIYNIKQEEKKRRRGNAEN